MAETNPEKKVTEDGNEEEVREPEPVNKYKDSHCGEVEDTFNNDEYQIEVDELWAESVRLLLSGETVFSGNTEVPEDDTEEL